MDLSRQLRHPLATMSADADKCYDRIHHIIMSLLLLPGDRRNNWSSRSNAAPHPIDEVLPVDRTRGLENIHGRKGP